MHTASTGLIGKGLYSFAEAGKLLRVPPRNLRRWTMGYTYSWHGEELASNPIIKLELPLREGHEAIVSFVNLMELKFVSMFRSKHVSTHVIRAALERARRLWKSEHPFCMERFRTDGKGIFGELEDRKNWPGGISGNVPMEELSRAQLVFSPMVEPFFLELDWDGRLANRYWPLGKHGRIVLDPRRSFGQPIDSQTGVPTFTLYQAFQGGESRKGIADWYDVPLAAVAKSIEYEESLLRKAA